jgi:predicted exporter
MRCGIASSRALSPISAAEQALDQSLRNDLGAPDTRYLIVAPAADHEQALAAAERIATALQPLVDKRRPRRLRIAVAVPAERGHTAGATVGAARARRTRGASARCDCRTAAPRRAARAVRRRRPGRRARKPLQREDLAGTSIAQALDALIVRQGERSSAVIALRRPRGPVPASIAGRSV